MRAHGHQPWLATHHLAPATRLHLPRWARHPSLPYTLPGPQSPCHGLKQTILNSTTTNNCRRRNDKLFQHTFQRSNQDRYFWVCFLWAAGGKLNLPNSHTSSKRFLARTMTSAVRNAGFRQRERGTSLSHRQAQPGLKVFVRTRRCFPCQKLKIRAMVKSYR